MTTDSEIAVALLNVHRELQNVVDELGGIREALIALLVAQTGGPLVADGSDALDRAHKIIKENG